MQVIGTVFEIARTEDNRWSAIRSQSPKFCFIDDDLITVTRQAERALKFYLGINDEIDLEQYRGYEVNKYILFD